MQQLGRDNITDNMKEYVKINIKEYFGNVIENPDYRDTVEFKMAYIHLKSCFMYGCTMITPSERVFYEYHRKKRKEEIKHNNTHTQ